MNKSNSFSIEGYIRNWQCATKTSLLRQASVVIYGNDGNSTFEIDNGSDLLYKSLHRSFKNRTKVKLTLEIPMSDIEEARDYLANGKDIEAIAKTLDVLERLDK